VGVRLHHSNPGEVIAGISAAWKTHFPADVLEYSFLNQSVAKFYHAELTTGKLMKLFAIVSLVVSCIGILGLSVFSILRRTREIGIRRVLGATQLNVILLLSKQYIQLLAAAFVVAAPLAYLAARQWLAGFAYHITPQWFMFVLPAVMMVSLTLLLIGSQSLRATHTNPVEALKE
jgi:putative ABC transport system permease protein